MNGEAAAAEPEPVSSEVRLNDSSQGAGEPDQGGRSSQEGATDQAMKCEIKHIERRYNEKSEHCYAERVEGVETAVQKDWRRLFAFCLVRDCYDSDDEPDLQTTALYVNSKPIRQLLADVIGNYPRAPIDVNNTHIEAPYYSLLHYRGQLHTEGLERFAEDPEALGHLRRLLDWIKTHFEREIAAYESCLNNEHKAMSYDMLWTLFPPRDYRLLQVPRPEPSLPSP